MPSQPISNQNIVPVVLSGGSGTRLWPASRQGRPKQLIPLVDDRSMIRATIERVSDIGSTLRPIVVTNEGHADAITSEMVLSGQSDALLILEPVGRNTAPAVAVAAHAVLDQGDPLMLILPADHIILDESAFHKAIALASKAASNGYLVTFGITPSSAETGYGYIGVGPEIAPSLNHVSGFREKPDRETATRYVESGEYLWNSGMFLIRASTYLRELESHAPDIAASCRAAYEGAVVAESRILLDTDSFSSCRSDSIDYAIMEQTSLAAVVPTDPGWSDVGSWRSLWEITEKDDDGNVIIGDVISIDTSDSYLRSSNRLIATLGIKDVIIVDTPDALLVASTDRAQDVKEMVEKLINEKRSETGPERTEFNS